MFTDMWVVDDIWLCLQNNTILFSYLSIRLCCCHLVRFDTVLLSWYLSLFNLSALCFPPSFSLLPCCPYGFCGSIFVLSQGACKALFSLSKQMSLSEAAHLSDKLPPYQQTLPLLSVLQVWAMYTCTHHDRDYIHVFTFCLNVVDL